MKEHRYYFHSEFSQQQFSHFIVYGQMKFLSNSHTEILLRTEPVFKGKLQSTKASSHSFII